MSRCTSYKYSLRSEPVDRLSSDQVGMYDVYLYLLSRQVETRTEYRLMSAAAFLSNVGGAMGLMLGLSCFSLVATAIEALLVFIKNRNK